MIGSKELKTTESAPFKKCCICDDVARGLNFNVMTCMSCKSFFRRNAYRKSSIAVCQFEKSCIITKRTRGFCTFCRLEKCFAMGMQPDLIRRIPNAHAVSIKSKQTKLEKRKRIQSPAIAPLGLLQKDRSTLSTDEWSLFSNLINSIDEKLPVTEIHRSLNELSSLPPRLRLKTSELMTLIRYLYTSIRPIIQHSPDFHSLSISTRQFIAKNNLYVTGVLNVLLLCNQLNMFQDVTFLNGCQQIYGDEYLGTCLHIVEKYDSNISLMKILMFILAFSTNCSTVRYSAENASLSTPNSMDLFRIQNIYATILWKYLVYQYGFNSAVLKYDRLVKHAVSLISAVNLIAPTEAHKQIMDTIVKKTEQALVLNE